ncbi:hypothetical protein MMU07_21560 [Aquiflexum sp. LQ15W]|uniref:hypothetical protein n=1 Tax=Cognataquiflexum nitidum TaxID=2922272 RepID=UPI001F1299C7|nr:hypothetical protein [Cognataquiflexum nitidum]MCH6202179.1 hypothetical protein [Cognataquiflexum nitidum]
MKKLLGIITIMFFLYNDLYSQKLYVWCQKEQSITPRNKFLNGEVLDIVVFDGRNIPSKSKVECESDSVVNNLIDLIAETYPSVELNIKENDDYYEKPEDNRITLKISISAFHAAFGADVKFAIGSVGGDFSWGAIPEGKWNALTGYFVSVYDYRNGKNKVEKKDIGKIASRPNTGGFRTAKNILNTTYMEANQELFNFIERVLMD